MNEGMNQLRCNGKQICVRHTYRVAQKVRPLFDWMRGDNILAIYTESEKMSQAWSAIALTYVHEFFRNNFGTDI